MDVKVRVWVRVRGDRFLGDVAARGEVADLDSVGHFFLDGEDLSTLAGGLELAGDGLQRCLYAHLADVLHEDGLVDLLLERIAVASGQLHHGGVQVHPLHH